MRTLSGMLRRNGKTVNLPSLAVNLSLREIAEITEVQQRRPAFQKLHYHLLIPWPKSEAGLEMLVERPVQADSGQRHDSLNTQAADRMIKGFECSSANFCLTCSLIYSLI